MDDVEFLVLLTLLAGIKADVSEGYWSITWSVIVLVCFASLCVKVVTG